MFDAKLSINRNSVKSNSGSIVFMSIDLFADQSTVIQKKGLNICLAIDCSGSMDGYKIEQAKESAIILARNLSPNDLISIISFENKVKVELAPTPASEQNKIETVIRSISVGGATSLYGGLKKAHEVILKNLHPGYISRIILMTDGIPTDKENPRDYEKLCSDMRVGGITVSPFGIGDDYNGEILMKISDAGGGEWMHVTNPYVQLQTFLREQVADMGNTILVNPDLRIKLLSGSEIVDCYTVKPVLTKFDLPDKRGDEYVLHIRDIIAGQEQTLALRIRLPAKPTGDYNLANVAIMNRTIDLKVNYTDDSNMYNVESNPNPRVLLFATEGTVLMRKGIEGDTVAMQKAETIIKSVDHSQATVLNPLTQDTVINLKQIHEQTVVNPNLSDADKKNLMHETTIIRRKSDVQ